MIKLRNLVTITLAGFGLSIVGLVSAFAIIQSRNQDGGIQVKNAESKLTQEELQNVPATLDVATIALHNSSNDCWLIIDQEVYNVTSFLANHPGGSFTITPYCGQDATRAFATKDKKPATRHSAVAIAMLADYRLGPVGTALAAIQASPSPNTQNKIVQVTPSSPDTVSKISTNDVVTTATLAVHNSINDCWLLINNKIYNVTSYIALHPGGSLVITPYCGRDASAAFASKGKNPGVQHSAYAQSLLNSYYIGTLGSSSIAAVTTQSTLVATTPSPTPLPSTSSTPPPVSNVSLTTATVATHHTTSDCWLIINNQVYNVTSYLTAHPGGISVVSPYCGGEATSAFQTKGGRGSNHSNNAYSLLSQYLVGTLNTTVTTTPTPASSSNPGSPSVPPGVPSSVSNKYPGATYSQVNTEDDGRTEIKLNYQGSCREIKTNSSGAITADKSC